MPGPDGGEVRGESARLGVPGRHARRTAGRVWIFLAAILVLLIVPAAALAAHGDVEETEGEELEPLTTELPDCMICHGQEYLGAVEIDGAREELYVDPDAYVRSAHALLPSNSCHIGFSHDNPHNMVTNAEFFAETAREACRNCHADQYDMYQQSYHGALERGGVTGGVRAPVCVDCHGNHAILEVGTLTFRQQIADICGQCHGGREATFLDTYHGKAITLGREASATCVDCHGSHRILPETNPESTLSEANILETCRHCHPDANEGLTTFLVHVSPTSTDAPLVVFLVAVFYIALIVAVFLFGGIHTLLYIYRGLKEGMYFGKGGQH